VPAPLPFAAPLHVLADVSPGAPAHVAAGAGRVSARPIARVSARRLTGAPAHVSRVSGRPITGTSARVSARPLSRLAGAFAHVVLAAAVSLTSACDRSAAESRPADPSPSGAASSTSSASPSASPAALALLDPNPFKLPSRTLALDPGRRVFTFSDQMLAGAKLGSTLVLYGATVAGFDGELLVIEGRNGPSYKVHPAYAIAVPDDPKVRPGEPVITEQNGVLRHAVVKKHVKDRIFVRYLDADTRFGEAALKAARFIRQSDGLHPGNYAALGDGEVLRHVLLVSPFDDGEKKWFVLGAGGAAQIVTEASLEPIPVKLQARAGAAVLAEHNGILRKATIQSAPEPGIFTVKYERAGRPATLGWGFLLPLAPQRPTRR